MNEPYQCIAVNVRRLRLERGWSVRELARQASLSTRTVVNVELGIASKLVTHLKLAETMQIPLECLCKPQPPGDRSWQIFRNEEARWYFANGQEAARHSRRYAAPTARRERVGYDRCPDSVQTESERFRLGANGQASGFFQERSGQLSAGGYKVRLVEIYGAVEFEPDPNDLAFQVHVLRGRVETDESVESNELASGDGLLYVADVPLVLRPSAPIASMDDVPLVLWTRLATLGGKRRRR